MSVASVAANKLWKPLQKYGPNSAFKWAKRLVAFSFLEHFAGLWAAVRSFHFKFPVLVSYVSLVAPVLKKQKNIYT